MPGISEGAFVTFAMVTVEVKLFKTSNSLRIGDNNCQSELLKRTAVYKYAINICLIFTFLHKLKSLQLEQGKHIITINYRDIQARKTFGEGGGVGVDN